MCIDSNAASSLFLLSANYFTYPALHSVCIDIWIMDSSIHTILLIGELFFSFLFFGFEILLYR